MGKRFILTRGVAVTVPMAEESPFDWTIVLGGTKYVFVPLSPPPTPSQTATVSPT